MDRYNLYEGGIDLEAVMNLNAAYSPEASKGTGSANMMTTNSAKQASDDDARIHRIAPDHRR